VSGRASPSTVSITVLPSPIIASIAGTDRSRASDAAITVSNDNSRDPDYIGTNPASAISFAWSCVAVASNTPCVLPGTVALTSPLLLLPPSTLPPFASYRVTLTVSSTSDARVSSTSIVLTTTAPSSVLVNIVDPPQRINTDAVLRLVGTTVVTSPPAGHPVNYTWTVESTNVPSTALPNLQLPANLGAPASSATLVLKANLLIPGAYKFTLTVTDPYTIDSSTGQFMSAFAATTVVVNQPPQPGVCRLTPDTGEALSTVFTMACSEWWEPEDASFLPFSYALQFIDLTNPAAGYQQLTTFSLNPTATFLLPAGTLSVRAVVRDTVLAFATADQPVTVTPVSEVLLNPLAYVRNISSTTLLAMLTAQQCTEPMSLVQQLAVVLNGAAGNPIYSVPASSRAEISRLYGVLTDQLDVAFSNCLAAAGAAPLSQQVTELASQSLQELTIRALQFPQTGILQATALGLVISRAAIQTVEPMSMAAFTGLGSAASQLMTNCSQLDSISKFAHTVLQARQAHAVAGEGIELDEANFVSFVTRQFLSAGSVVQLPTGQAITLSASVIAAYAAELDRLTPDTIDGPGVEGAAEMDTRVVVFDIAWANCRSSFNDGKQAISSPTTFELTFPNGDTIDWTKLGEGGVILLQLVLDPNSTQHTNDNEVVCADGTVVTDPSVNSTDPWAAYSCSFWNVTSLEYSTAGCTSLGVSLNRNNQSVLTCACTHLTEFTILYSELTATHNGLCPSDSYLGDTTFLIFMGVYAAVGLASVFQLGRMLLFLRPLAKHALMVAEYTLIAGLCFFRGLNMAIYWKLYASISFKLQTLLSGIPYLFVSWINTFVIVTWAAVYATTTKGKRAKNPFEAYLLHFIGGNGCISLALFGIFVSMALIDDLGLITRLNHAGILVTCGVEIGFAIFFLTYGGLLYCQLTKTISHGAYARKLLAIAVSLSLCFALSAVVLMISVFAPDTYDEFFLRFASSYFTFDLLAICIVLILFAKSLTDAIAATKSGAAAKSLGTKGAKSTMDESSRVGSRTATTRAGGDSATFKDRSSSGASARSGARAGGADAKPATAPPARKGTTGLTALREEEIELAELPLGEHGVDFGDFGSPEELGGEVYEFGDQQQDDEFEPGAIELTTLGRVVGSGGSSASSVVALDLRAQVPRTFTATRPSAPEAADIVSPSEAGSPTDVVSPSVRARTVDEVGEAAAALVQSMLDAPPSSSAIAASPPARRGPTIHSAGGKALTLTRSGRSQLPTPSAPELEGVISADVSASATASPSLRPAMDRPNSFVRRTPSAGAVGSSRAVSSQSALASRSPALAAPRNLPPLAARRAELSAMPVQLRSPSSLPLAARFEGVVPPPVFSTAAASADAVPPSDIIRSEGRSGQQVIRLTRAQTLHRGAVPAAAGPLAPIPVAAVEGAPAAAATGVLRQRSDLSVPRRTGTAPSFQRTPSRIATAGESSGSGVEGSSSASDALAAAAATASLTRMQAGLAYMPASKSASSSPAVSRQPSVHALLRASSSALFATPPGAAPAAGVAATAAGPVSGSSSSSGGGRLAVASRPVGVLGSSPSLSMQHRPSLSHMPAAATSLQQQHTAAVPGVAAARAPFTLDSDEDD